MKAFGWIHLQEDVRKVDDDLLAGSRLARAGARIIQLAVIARAVEPALVLIVTALLVTVPALAQTPGGNIFGGNDQ